MLVPIHQTTWFHVSQVRNLQSHRENFKWTGYSIAGAGYLLVMVASFDFHPHNAKHYNCHRQEIEPRISSQSQSQLLYDWQFTANQFVLATSPLS
jgi:hypothetical protein